MVSGRHKDTRPPKLQQVLTLLILENGLGAKLSNGAVVATGEVLTLLILENGLGGAEVDLMDQLKFQS